MFGTSHAAVFVFSWAARVLRQKEEGIGADQRAAHRAFGLIIRGCGGGIFLDGGAPKEAGNRRKI